METDNAIAEHLRQIEEQLLQPEVRSNAEEVSAHLADDFMEFGSTGRVYNKAEILTAIAREQTARYSIKGFKTTAIASGVALVTYRASRLRKSGEEPVESLRSSLWKLIDGRWRMVFHQGTLIVTRIEE